jgi:hypothetical protein
MTRSHVSIGMAICLAVVAVAAQAQSPTPTKPRSPKDIADASRVLAAKNEDCRQEANKLHLHMLNRLRFMHQCRIRQ